MTDIDPSDLPDSLTDDPEDDAGRWRGPAINHVDLLGRLTANPTLGHTRDGIPVAHVRMATNERNQTEHHQIVAWRELSEIVMRFARQGQLVHVTGRLHGHSWTDLDSTKHDGTEIIAESFQVLERIRRK